MKNEQNKHFELPEVTRKSIKIDFSFSGEVRGAQITDVTTFVNDQLQTKYVGDEDPDDVVRKLEKGEYMIALGDHLYDSKGAEIRIIDFEVS